jgi:uncharacterized membrane-anchored protein
MLNKVPEITLYFWIIKVLCTTIGETAADFLNVNLNLGLTGTSIVTGLILIVALAIQFRTTRYIPVVYWFTVALVSVFGTLVTDNLTDALGVPLETSTILFSVLLAVSFTIWYLQEKTLSIHSIVTRKREAFYWLAILVTFALGTAAGDLMAEGLGLGYLVTGVIVAALIAVFAVARMLGMHRVLAFWLIYILTRPLGASIGDYLSQSPGHGGLGLGVTMTSAIFMAGIVAIVAYLSITKKDVIGHAPTPSRDGADKGGLWQTIVVVGLLLVAAGIGYAARQSTLDGTSPTTAGNPAEAASFGDVSGFRVITNDTLDLVKAGDQAGAKNRIGDLEYEWDNAESTLKKADRARWTEIDDAIDAALRQVRAVRPDAAAEQSALEALLAVLG